MAHIYSSLLILVAEQMHYKYIQNYFNSDMKPSQG